MKIKTIKELEKIILLCQQHNVPEITIDGVHMRIDAPTPIAQPKVTKDSDAIETDPQYTDDQLATWSGN